MSHRVALTGLATVMVIGLLGCGGSKRTVTSVVVSPGGIVSCTSGCGANGAPARVTVRRDGRVGPLKFNRSTRAQVVAFAGKPTSELRGRMGPGLPAVDALYYGCHHTAKERVGEDFSCRTIIWVSRRTGRFIDFWTRDPRYVTATGVHVGTPTAGAERALHTTAQVGCGGASLPLGNRISFRHLVLFISGSHLGNPKKSGARAFGGHVSLMVWFGSDASQVVNC